jgi:REP element-mobilizing transposase RayT
MGRLPRYVPPGGALVEVTTRTQDARFLLRPSDPLNDVIIGILARAKRLYPLRICGLAFASNHYHLLLDVDDAQTLSRFMGYVNGNLAREAGRLHDWHHHLWSRRYQSVVVSNEELTQTERLAYVLAHGVKEGLCERVLSPIVLNSPRGIS